MGVSDRSDLIGQTIDGRYLVTGLIGEGGMGRVYRAQHIRIGRAVAIKCLHVQYAADHNALQGFFDEACAAATLEHANIAEATDMGELKDGSPYIVLELLDGRSLHDEIDYVGRLSVRRSLRIAKQIAAGVKAAHDAGIIHRDLKSDNVFLIDRNNNPDHVKIFDFGVARVLGRVGSNTKPGTIVGTPEFMPPEQITDPDTIDVRADVYAVGAILYHMLTGKPPYGEALPVTELLAKVLEEPPQAVTGVPQDVRAVVEDAMARDRDDRIASMELLLDRLDRIVLPGSSSPSIPAVSPPRRRSDPPLPRPAAPFVAGQAPRTSSARLRVALVAGSLAGIVGAYFIWQGMKAPSPPAPQPTPIAAAEPAPPPAPTPLPVRVVGRQDLEADPTPTPPPLITRPTPPPHPTAHPTPAPHPNPNPKSSSHPKKPDPETKTPKIEARPDVKVSPEVVKPPDPAKPAVKPEVPPPIATPATPPSATGPKPGTIDVAATRAAIRPHLGVIQRCYERAKMDDLSLTGGVTIRIGIGAAGNVTSADVTKSTLGSPAAEHCITQEIASWQLPQPSGGVASSLIYPFVFE